jgi:hypothetical protein
MGGVQRTSGSPHKDRYDPAVPKMKRRSVEEARADLGRLIAAGAEGKLDEHSPVSRHGRVGVVIVPLDWYRQAREALGDPTDL